MEGDMEEASAIHRLGGKVGKFGQRDGGSVDLSSSFHEEAGKIGSRVATGLQSVKEEGGVLVKVLSIRVLPVEPVQSSVDKSE